VKKLLGKLFNSGPSMDSIKGGAPPPLVPPGPPPRPSGAPAKKSDFLGRRAGVVIFICFPEYPELAQFLADEARALFRKDYANIVQTAVGKLVSLTEVSNDGVATIAIDESGKQTPEAIAKTLDELDKHLLTWVGTFGRLSIPVLKFRVGVGRGEMTISEIPPKIQGPALAQAMEIARTFCEKFDVRIGSPSELMLAAKGLEDWLDLDDWPMESGKPLRLYTKLNDRLERYEVQTLRNARKAYFQQNWDEAGQQLDRLSQVRAIRGIVEIYEKRIQRLKKRPKIQDWDGVYRKEKAD